MIMNLPIMSIVAASTPVAAVATTTTATAIVSRPVTTAAAIVPNDIFLIYSVIFLFIIIILNLSFLKTTKRPVVVKFFIMSHEWSGRFWACMTLEHFHYFKLTSAYDYSYYHSRIEVSLTRRDIKILKVIFFISLIFDSSDWFCWFLGFQ